MAAVNIKVKSGSVIVMNIPEAIPVNIVITIPTGKISKAVEKELNSNTVISKTAIPRNIPAIIAKIMFQLTLITKDTRRKVPLPIKTEIM